MHIYLYIYIHIYLYVHIYTYIYVSMLSFSYVQRYHLKHQLKMYQQYILELLICMIMYILKNLRKESKCIFTEFLSLIYWYPYFHFIPVIQVTDCHFLTLILLCSHLPVCCYCEGCCVCVYCSSNRSIIQYCLI